ncbi:winged helix-turn-helix domain-containing protein [Spirosoma endbachense]|uniref:Transcriptional regulator n=1 Tax=Spirosoma endbachense TaxID=2666025 RepID=A0A6P1VN09_9BACT|nr:winged helix-turn-helix domain-containing protein [Spirosoma endbachense]QHV94463.1 transcriptional regulator [Spirosoma endbachense]
MRKVAVIIGLLVAGLLFTQFVWLTPVVRYTETDHFAQKVNLALRRTTHLLLKEKGDSTSRIPPVQQINATTFIVRLERPFDYGRLPALLQQSLDVHEIKTNYDVAVLDCTNGELQLGYNFRDVSEKNEVPCGGRQQGRGCYNLQVIFKAAEKAHDQQAANWWSWALGVLLLGGVYVVWHRADKTTKEQTMSETGMAEPENLIRVGRVALNMSNQSVKVDGISHVLTYREAKLFHLFVRYPNQVLERDFILKSVWEDEGIIVGRSLDVFVSRLRKLLQPDSTVRIVAVHGVGYRLEVQQ